MEAPPTGPYVQAALFCEMLLESKDNVASIIRVIDRVTHTVVDPGAPDELPPFSYSANAVIMLKGGGARGTCNLDIVREAPDATIETVASGTVTFSGAPQQGVTVQLRVDNVYTQTGIYWFDVILDGKLLTKMPFEVVYQRVRPGRAS